MQVKELSVKKIKIGDRWTTPDNAEIKSIAESIKEVGLLEPIGVNKKGTELIYGLTRLEAAKLLGWKTIPANVLDVDALTAQLMELYENLKRRKPGTALEEADTLKRAKELYEELHPQTAHGGDRGNQYTGGKRQELPLATFTENAAKQTGKSERTIRAQVSVAESIPEPVKEAIKGSPIADNRAELARLGKLPEKTQAAVAKAIHNGKAETVKEAVELVQPKPPAKPKAGEGVGKCKAKRELSDIIGRAINRADELNRQCPNTSAHAMLLSKLRRCFSIVEEWEAE